VAHCSATSSWAGCYDLCRRVDALAGNPGGGRSRGAAHEAGATKAPPVPSRRQAAARDGRSAPAVARTLRSARRRPHQAPLTATGRCTARWRQGALAGEINRGARSDSGTSRRTHAVELHSRRARDCGACRPLDSGGTPTTFRPGGNARSSARGRSRCGPKAKTRGPPARSDYWRGGQAGSYTFYCSVDDHGPPA